MKKVIRKRVKSYFPIKLNLKMRITTLLLLLVSLFQLHANDSYAQKTKVSLNYTNVSLETVFNEIESITDFKFLYKDNEINYNQKVSIRVKKEPLSNVLKKLLNDSKISYVVNGKQIILKPLQISSNTKLETINEVAQKISVTGIIVDKSGEPLPGASIIEKGTSNGTETDFNGNFSIDVKNKGAILVVQYLGYAKKEVPVKDKTNLIKQPRFYFCFVCRKASPQTFSGHFFRKNFRLKKL
jgi:hypothetical protein